MNVVDIGLQYSALRSGKYLNLCPSYVAFADPIWMLTPGVDRRLDEKRQEAAKLKNELQTLRFKKRKARNEVDANKLGVMVEKKMEQLALAECRVKVRDLEFQIEEVKSTKNLDLETLKRLTAELEKAKAELPKDERATPSMSGPRPNICGAEGNVLNAAGLTSRQPATQKDGKMT